MIQLQAINAADLMKQYTVLNKDVARLERIRGRPMPWMRWIKLFVQKGSMAYFPVGLFSDMLWKGNDLSAPLEFLWSYREEQQRVVENVGKTGLIVMKTWKGKTNTAIGIIEKYQKKAVIAVHSIITLHQMVKSFKDFAGIEVWEYHWSKKKAWDIMITTHDSLAEKYGEIKKLCDFSILIVDECDRNVTPKMLEAVIFSDPQYFYGMTGTPKRADLHEQDLQMIYGPMLKMPDQENNWYLMIPKIKRLISYDTKFFSFENRHDLRDQMCSDNERINKQCKYIIDLWEKKAFKYWLMLVLRREKESEMYYKILGSHLPCYLMHWLTKKKEDIQSAADFKDTGGLLIGTTWKLWRWLDIPHLDSLFMFYPGRFRSDSVQSVWRILRLDEGKQQPIVYDRCDYPILKKQAEERLHTYKDEYWANISIETITL